MQVICVGCSSTFDKLQKEYDRQKRRGRNEFYCSRQCFGRAKGSANLGEGYVSTPEHLSKMCSLAAKANTKFYGDEKVFGEILRRARQRKRGFDLDIECLRNIWESQQGRCRLTNISLVLSGSDPVVRASLDRIDPTKGYVRGNVQFVSCSVNWAKNSGVDDDIRRLVKLIVAANL